MHGGIQPDPLQFGNLEAIPHESVTSFVPPPQIIEKTIHRTDPEMNIKLEKME
jgi:hypothetical protein